LQNWYDFVSYHNKAFPELGRNTFSQLEDSAYMFDAVWVAALALNKTNEELLNFNYEGESSINISQSIYNNLVNVKFFGLTVSEISAAGLFVILLACIHNFTGQCFIS